MRICEIGFSRPKGLRTSTDSWEPYQWGAGVLFAASLFCCLLACVQARASFQPLQSIDPPPGVSSGQISPLLQGSDGLLYGMTSAGGTSNMGTIFGLSTNGDGYAEILSFTVTNGSAPSGRLFEGADGSLYGTTSAGGANGSGTVFKVNRDGSSFAVLHNFGSTTGDGETPFAGLVQGIGGVLYGTTSIGGSGRAGTVFKLNQDGSGYTVLHSFVGFSGAEGSFPFTALVQGSDGALYGATDYGGANELGVLFKLNTDGTSYTVLHDFMGPAGNDGRPPLAELIEGTNGMLYGTTYFGGTNDSGTVFSLGTGGTGYSVLYYFGGGTNGGEPWAGLVQGAQGDLYGTTRFGGAADLGTAFRLKTDGSGYTVLHSFTGVEEDGAEPAAALLVASNGALYGSTLAGGSDDDGIVFKLSLVGRFVISLTYSSGQAAKADGWRSSWASFSSQSLRLRRIKDHWNGCAICS